MKLRTFLAVGFIAAASTVAAQAQQFLYITGSTAYRGNVYTSIQAVYDASPAVQFGYSGSGGLSKAGQAVFVGNIGGNQTIIKTSFSGSEGGIQAVTSPNSIMSNYLSDPIANGGLTTVSATPGTGSQTNTVAHTSDMAFSDTAQALSQFNGTYKGVAYATATEDANSPLGVVPFKWVASVGAPAGLTNITDNQAQSLFHKGTLSLGVLTGNAADENSAANGASGTTLYATGRDPDSGTRVTAFADAGIGAQAINVRQTQPRNAANAPITTVGGGPIASAPLYPAGTVNGINFGLGVNGFAGGGTLAAAISNASNAFGINGSKVVFITYLGIGDADGTALINGCKELSFNGISLGLPEVFNVIYEGQYGFWGYEHALYNPGPNLTPGSPTVGALIVTDLKNVHAQVLLSNMHVTRTEGGDIIGM